MSARWSLVLTPIVQTLVSEVIPSCFANEDWVLAKCRHKHTFRLQMVLDFSPFKSLSYHAMPAASHMVWLVVVVAVYSALQEDKATKGCLADCQLFKMLLRNNRALGILFVMLMSPARQ